MEYQYAVATRRNAASETQKTQAYAY